MLNYSNIYGSHVYHFTTKHFNSKEKREETLNFQFIIANDPSNIIDDSYDCTLWNLSFQERYYTKELRFWLHDSFNHFFEIEPDKTVSFKIDISQDRNSLKAIKFGKFMRIYKNDFKLKVNKVKENIYEFFIGKK